MRTEQIQQTLEKLTASSPEIEGAALVDREGFILASRLPENLDEDRVAALMAAFQDLALRSSGELNKGRPTHFFLQAEQGYILLTAAGDDACLALFSSRLAKPGMLLLDLRNAAGEIRNLLAP